MPGAFDPEYPRHFILRRGVIIRQFELTNVNFVTEFMPLSQLLPYAAQSTINLGVFGDVEKTRYVVPNKVYDGLAMGRAVITVESSAISEFFTPNQHLVTVPPGDPAALAAAIRALLDHSGIRSSGAGADKRGVFA